MVYPSRPRRRAMQLVSACAYWWVLSSVASAGDLTSNIWLSRADNGPEAPVIQVVEGETLDLDIWARPASGQILNAFSLTLLATGPAAISFEDITVHNPALNVIPAADRFQVVFDSDNDLVVEDDMIKNFAGISVLNGLDQLPNGVGVGVACSSDPECFTGSGSPSWRLATVTIEALAAGNSVDLNLMIGTQGISHFDSDPTDTKVIFGGPDDEVNQWMTHGLEPDDRDEPQGQVDAVIQVVDQLSSADFDVDNDVDGIDFSIWQRGFGTGDTFAEGDANGDNQVDDLDLHIWQMQYGTDLSATAFARAIPEPISLALVLAGAVTCVGSRCGR